MGELSQDSHLNGGSGANERIAVVTTVLASPPPVHPRAGKAQVWNTQRSCYEFMARHVSEGSRTLETGAGVSTVLFAAWGCEHLCVVPGPNQREAVLKYCAESGFGTDALDFDLRGSEVALPEIPPERVFDLFLIDGNHGFPTPIIDWFYGAGHLREGGIVVFDDLEIPQVGHWLEWFLDKDSRWERIESTSKWAAYRRHSSGPLGEVHDRQPFLTPAPTSRALKHLRRIAARGKAELRARARPSGHDAQSS